MSSPLRIGTRASRLAMWQAHWVKSALEERWPGLSVELVQIRTSGDKIQNVPLSEVGGKGLFTKEIDDALLGGRIDAAVHSMKDIPYQLPHGLGFCAIPEREDPRDALLSNGRELDNLPPAARIGTSSLRRQVQLRHHIPSLKVTTLRGNVDTRLKKLENGEFEGIILALAGLRRLGYESAITQILDPALMLPAIGQGALGITCRTDDQTTRDRFSLLDHEPTRLAVSAERGLLASLEGSCKVPIAGHARIVDGQILLEGLVANLAGTVIIRETAAGMPAKAEELGLTLGREMIARGAKEILREIAENGTPG